MENVECMILCRNKMFGGGGWLSHPPLLPSWPQVLKACLCGGLGVGRKIELLRFFFLRSPPSQPGCLPSVLPAAGPLEEGAQTPSLPPPAGHGASKRALSAEAGRPAGPRRRIALRAPPVTEFPSALPPGVGGGSSENPGPSFHSSTLPLVTFQVLRKGESGPERNWKVAENVNTTLEPSID